MLVMTWNGGHFDHSTWPFHFSWRSGLSFSAPVPRINNYFADVFFENLFVLTTYIVCAFYILQLFGYLVRFVLISESLFSFQRHYPPYLLSSARIYKKESSFNVWYFFLFTIFNIEQKLSHKLSLFYNLFLNVWLIVKRSGFIWQV